MLWVELVQKWEELAPAHSLMEHKVDQLWEAVLILKWVELVGRQWEELDPLKVHKVVQRLVVVPVQLILFQQ